MQTRGRSIVRSRIVERRVVITLRVMTLTPCALIKEGISITHTYDRGGHMSLLVAVAETSDDFGVHRVTVITAERDDYIEIAHSFLARSSGRLSAVQ
jgi:hypothetical protein